MGLFYVKAKPFWLLLSPMLPMVSSYWAPAERFSGPITVFLRFLFFFVFCFFFVFLFLFLFLFSCLFVCLFYLFVCLFALKRHQNSVANCYLSFYLELDSSTNQSKIVVPTLWQEILSTTGTHLVWITKLYILTFYCNTKYCKWYLTWSGCMGMRTIIIGPLQ